MRIKRRITAGIACLCLLFSSVGLAGTPTGKTWDRSEFTERCADGRKAARCINFATIALTWEHPTQREDNSTLERREIAYYIIEMTKDSGTPKLLPVGPSDNFTLKYMPSGAYSFRISTVDTTGLQGDFSDAIGVNIQ